MPAWTRRHYIERLARKAREVWLRRESVKDVTTRSGWAGGVRTTASLYDMKHDAKVGREMTDISLTSSDRVDPSFIIPAPRKNSKPGSRTACHSSDIGVLQRDTHAARAIYYMTVKPCSHFRTGPGAH
jgi:aromatic ring hydroxylase